MLNTVGRSPKDYEEWRDFIIHKVAFYVANPTQIRTDPDFPWDQIDKPLPEAVAEGKPGLIDRLWRRKMLEHSKVAAAIAADVDLRNTQERHIRNFKRNAEKSFAVRCLFEDDLSRQIFDDTIVLRLAGHRHFIGPRVHFERILEKVSETPFEFPNFPSHYLGVPLVEMNVAISMPERQIQLALIAPEGFDRSFNSYRQYFQRRGRVDFFPKEGDVILDCGSCIGDMSKIYAGFAGETGHVYAFDPIPLHSRFCELQNKRNQAGSSAITPVNFAVGNETRKAEVGSVEEIVAISPGGLQISKFNIIRCDDFVVENGIKRVDFIKMDIEGAEPDALEGASTILRDMKPKLAISVYHRPDHLWSIPLQIKEINPDYRFFFGHHSPVRWESVVYAY